LSKLCFTKMLANTMVKTYGQVQWWALRTWQANIPCGVTNPIHCLKANTCRYYQATLYLCFFWGHSTADHDASHLECCESRMCSVKVWYIRQARTRPQAQGRYEYLACCCSYVIQYCMYMQIARVTYQTEVPHQLQGRNIAEKAEVRRSTVRHDRRCNSRTYM
jgi:hypothetical protein